MRARVDDAGRRARSRRRRCSAAAIWRTCWPPRRWRSSSASRSTTIADRRGAAPPGRSPRRGAAAARRHHAHRRFVQLEPDGAAPRARRDRARIAARTEGRGARRDARARRPRRARCTRSAAARPPRPASRALFAIGGAPARALADAAVDAGMPADGRAPSSSTSADAAPRRRRRTSGAATWCWSRDRAARAPTSWPTGSRRSSADAVSTCCRSSPTPFLGALNVTRYITFRTAAASLTALAISLLLRPLADPQAARLPDRPDHPAGRAAVAPRQGRHADDGRAADPDRGGRADAAVGGSLEPVHLDRGAGDGRLRRGRLPRRLPEDHAPVAPRADPALQDGAARSSSALGVGVAVLLLSQQNPPLYNTRLIFPFFKNLIPDLGVVLRRVRRARARRSPPTPST